MTVSQGKDVAQISDFLDYRLPVVDKFMNDLYDVEK